MLTPKKLKIAISDQVVNKHGLGRYLTNFLIPNKDLLLKSGKLSTLGLEATNIRVIQIGESLALILWTYLKHTSDIISPLVF